MKKTLRISQRLASCGLLMLAVAPSFGAPVELRAFGKIEASFTQPGDPGLTVFACESAEKALLLAQKLGRDMEQSATVPARWESVKIADREAPVLIREGIGSFLIAASGRDVLVFTSPKTANLAQVFASAAARLKGAKFFDSAYKYPVFYDKFSSAGIGSWYPSYSGNAAAKGRPDSVSDHFAYAQKLGLTIQPTGGGFVLRNLLPILREYERPYHFAQWHEWNQDIARMAPEDLVSPGDTFTNMPHYYGQISDGGYRLRQYRNWDYQNMMKGHVDDPLLVDWLDPNGEVGPMANFKYWDFSEANRRNLIHYLRDERKYTLGTLGEAWYGDEARFKSWDDVRIPMDYSFFGFGEGDILASKSWRIHPAPTGVEGKGDFIDWSKLVANVPPYLRDGLANGYQTTGFNDSGWAEFQRPGGELAAIHWDTGYVWAKRFFWRRGSIDVDAAWLDKAGKSGRVYMTFAALDQSIGWKEPDRVWINGVEAGTLFASPGTHVLGQLDVTGLIKPGKNSIVYLGTAGMYSTDGPIFLTTRKREEYPFSDTHRNARYRDWDDYIAWAVSDKMEETYKAMRAEDPDRFIKLHAASYLNLSIPLALKYGCYSHFTGEGAFFHPWDKRMGYPYGVPASAEFGSSIVDPAAWKRWLGWFTFEGLNALDNFLYFQDIMYSPVKDLWAQNMPYIHLANRRDIRKPDLALFFSARNSQMLPRPVPLCFDIGRGDLQSIGYSNVYVDEEGVKKGLLKDYPIVWDTGSVMMDEATVAGLKKYVEEGGTFVALQETGRDTFTRRDAWPISDLTGYKVREQRPMTGAVFILAEQPIFKRLAGRNFYNRGKSIDYSDFNYADKCFALDPVAPDTTALARYDDGSIAIGMRKLGKGRVITLASPFWRDSYDKGGMWWPGEGQSEFLEDLLGGLGVKPLAKADTHDVWREHFLANNGTEEYLALFNPNDTPRTFTVEWNTVKPAAALYDPKNGEKIRGVINGNTVKIEKITLDGLETRIVAAQPATTPGDAVHHWFKQLALWWRPSAPGEILTRPALPSYVIQLADRMKGRVVSADELQKLDPAALSKKPAPGAGFELYAGQSAEEFRGKPDDQRRIVLQCPLEIPKNWSPRDRIELIVNRVAVGGDSAAAGVVDAYINGTKVLSQANAATPGRRAFDVAAMEDGAVADIGKVIDFHGTNALCVVAGQNGFVGEIKLRRKPPVAEEIEVKGTFQVQLDADSGVGQAAVPGVVKGLYAWKNDVEVPSSWKGSRVFIELNVANIGEYEAFAINDKVIFHPVNFGTSKPVTWMDITPWVKFGGPNRLTLISKNATKNWTPGAPEYKSIQLQRVDPRDT
ncbi:MAG: hypothetical protein PHC88_09710 [Terrimicrobiaceae bacterium]|nr:hypothetical protein [Terrimicrobiaceae bacterium]